MSLRAVRFKPRPVHPELECGTEWIPKGLEYCPYHPDFEKEVVWDGMDERKFKCSATLELYLNEFYQDMAPLIMTDLPPLHSPESISEIRARHDSSSGTHKTLRPFKERVLETPIVELMEDEKSAFRVVNADILSMRSELIELKVWASMYSEIDEYLLAAYDAPPPKTLPLSSPTSDRLQDSGVKFHRLLDGRRRGAHPSSISHTIPGTFAFAPLHVRALTDSIPPDTHINSLLVPVARFQLHRALPQTPTSLLRVININEQAHRGLWAEGDA
ncbi:hypothetical protein B0H16DRAFT_1753708 [Mycena metata]|uniref:Uncharacterized protein n=1 Tax=Mycena metata TaxID=1033252 RepID=A0AAD7P326_9AGAR|nr:hypothetical protein B0H16DRAFT_1753708 [Mycena metata]